MDYIKILLIILCISISIYFIYHVFQERFVNCNKDLVVSNKPLYINNGEKIDIDSLNCKKLCIKDSEAPSKPTISADRYQGKTVTITGTVPLYQVHVPGTRYTKCPVYMYRTCNYTSSTCTRYMCK